MARGRPRLHDASIPAHIVQTDIPRGAYWSRQDRVWYTIVDEGDKRRRRKLAGPEARLSDLQRLLEDYEGLARSSVGWLCDRFAESTHYAGLAEKTQADYDAQRRLVNTYQTKVGSLASIKVGQLSLPFMQRIVENIGSTHPAKANHLMRYLRMVFGWGVRLGHCKANPAQGFKQAKERKRRRLPAPTVYMAVLSHARANSPAYLSGAIELAFLCRLRGIEVITLTDAHEQEEGIQTNRRKNSRDTLVLWSPRLRAAWAAAQAERRRIWEKTGHPVPLRAEDRRLLVNVHGKPVTRGALSTIWQTLMHNVIEAGVITEEQRFGLHDAKRKGITDTTGTRAEKQDASGHRTPDMMNVYDLSVSHVTTPGGV